MSSTNKRAHQPTHFAMIDDVVSVGRGDGTFHEVVILDCITREAAAKLRGKSWADIRDNDESFDETMVLSVDLSSQPGALPSEWTPGQWVRFSATELQNSISPEQSILASFVSLSGSVEQRAIAQFSLNGIAPTKSPLGKLSLLVGMNSRKDEISEGLRLAQPRVDNGSRNVVVYDVGQGNATALVDVHGRPVIYFDIGWPTSMNARTRPIDPPLLFAPDTCLHCNHRHSPCAPVILSHWDFDHWAYAVANDSYDYGKKAAKMKFRAEALNRPWIVPKPPRIKNTKGLGPTHMRLLTALPQRLFWPNSMKSVSFFAGVLTRTDPKISATDRNNQSLTWFVMRPGSSDAMLLSGDVSFNRMRLPSVPVNVTSLMASHHGGIISGISKFLPKASWNNKLVISVGAGNEHKHPRTKMLAEYSAKGWTKEVRTSTRTIWAKSAKRNGSILMKLHAIDPAPHFCCTCLKKGNLGNTQ